MRALKPILFLLLIFTLTGPANSVSGQSVQHVLPVHQHPVFQSIDDAMQRGQITQESAILQKFYYVFEPEKTEYLHSKENQPPIKCIVPIIQEYLHTKDQLSSFAVSEIERFTSESRLEFSNQYLSPSGNFLLHYDTEGIDAVPAEDSNQSGIPDYIEHAAFAADSSYRFQVETTDFTDFRRTQPYNIYFEDLRGGLYGFAERTPDRTSTFIVVHSTFEDFPPNTHPEGDVTGALYATLAHEMKHAIQYATNRWEGQAGSFNWIEMDATLMEEVVFPDVNDYYNYIKSAFDSDTPNSQSIFSNPRNPAPGAYWHVTWMIYFAEQFGIDFWVDVWDQFTENRTKPFFEAVENSLALRNTNLSREHLVNHLWHMGSGPLFATTDFGFSDRNNYPNPNFSGFLTAIPDSLRDFSLRPMAAHYVDATPSGIALGQPKVTIESDIPGVGIGIIGYFRDGTTREQFIVNPESNTQTIQTTWNWADLVDVSLAVVNTSQAQNAEYLLTFGSTLPEGDLLAQNYPNPFNPSTRIEFSIADSKPVRIEIFDTIGRKIATLLDQNLDAGFHAVEFDGSGLASGIYFYRISTDQAVVSRKMMLIK